MKSLQDERDYVRRLLTKQVNNPVEMTFKTNKTPGSQKSDGYTFKEIIHVLDGQVAK